MLNHIRQKTISPNIIIGEDESVQVPDILLSTMPYSAIGRVKATYYDVHQQLEPDFYLVQIR